MTNKINTFKGKEQSDRERFLALLFELYKDDKEKSEKILHLIESEHYIKVQIKILTDCNEPILW